MTKQQEREEIKKARENFTGKRGQPISSRERLFNENKARKRENEEFAPTASQKGLDHNKTQND